MAEKLPSRDENLPPASPRADEAATNPSPQSQGETSVNSSADSSRNASAGSSADASPNSPQSPAEGAQPKLQKGKPLLPRGRAVGRSPQQAGGGAKGANPEAAARPAEKAKAAPGGPTKLVQAAEKPSREQVGGEQAPVVEREQEQSRVSFLLWEIIHWMPSWFVSMVVHAVALLIMAMITLPAPQPDTVQQLVVAPGQNEQLEEIEEFLAEVPEDINLATDITQIDVASHIETSQDISPFDDQTAAMGAVELSPIGLEHAPQTDLLASVGALTGDAFSGRGSGKERLVRTAGGTEGSEQAVALALKWLADHQLPDGGWSFDHTKAGGCNGQCRSPGTLADARAAATAMALLPFLGAGQTHREGKYVKNVRAGLYFLITNRMKISPEGGSFHESGGNMYSHGLASITLCEAYGMTHDRVLSAPAQQALNFICYAQDPVGGGWRYKPREKGDTSVVGWQLMALKSGAMAYLQVPKVTIQKAQAFLDSVQANGGATYGYLDPGSGPGTTAVGLLCRMYLGWDKNHPALQKGVKTLSDWGPSIDKSGPGRNNFYYNYYATQVMRHWEGEEWKKWNRVMRDYLVTTQAKKGHETGSWYFENSGDHGKERGGRLYFTSLATLILEVYYRHMPLYRKQATAENFPLD